MLKLAPIALFVYNRPIHTEKVLKNLVLNELSEQSKLFIFSDGPKKEMNESQLEKIFQVRKLIQSKNWCKEVQIIEAKENKGLSRSIIEGINYVLSIHEKIIVLEDDIVVSKYFLNFMNDALNIFEDRAEVISVCGYLYPAHYRFPKYFFQNDADCWGWATWKRGWKLFNENGVELVNEIIDRGLVSAFNKNNSYPFFQMLEGQINGQNDSWAIRWHASAFLNKKLSLYPGRSLVKHIGNDNTGLNFGKSNILDTRVYNKPIVIDKVKFIEEDINAKKALERFLRKLSENRLWKIKTKIRLLIKDILPPFSFKIIKYFISSIKKNKTNTHLEYYGSFSSWDEAKKNSIGYESDIILDKVKNSLLKVKNGEAVYERDSFLFAKIQYPWPLLANLLWIASNNKNNLNIIDFGGSLGSTYFQNINYLKHLNSLRWNVVEQKSFVECGREFFKDKNLNFYYTINECLKNNKPDAIMLSSVLQYLEKPYDFLEELISYNFKYILFDRTYFSETEEDRITIQVVPKNIYEASYPCWFFSLKKFLSIFQNNYRLISDFEDYVGLKFAKGFIFEIKKIT